MPHLDRLVQFIRELYSRQGVKNAEPMSECGQGLIFVEASNKVAGELFTDCGTDQSKLGVGLSPFSPSASKSRSRLLGGTGLA